VLMRVLKFSKLQKYGQNIRWGEGANRFPLASD